MFFGLIALPIVAFFYLKEGVSLMEGLHQIDPSLLSLWGEGGFTMMNLATVLGFIFIGLGFLGSPQIFVRFMSIRDEAEINKGRWVAILFTLLADTAAILIGMMSRYLFTDAGVDSEAVLGNNAQNVLITLVEFTMPAVIVGLYVAIVLSAIMSTVDSLLVVASSAVIRDFYQQIFNPNLKLENLTKISRLVTLGMALIALAIAMIVAITTPERTIFWFVIFGWSGIAGTFCPVIILSLTFPKCTENGAIAAMITGFLGVPFFKFVAPTFSGIGPYFEQIAELGPAFFMALLVGVLVSKIWPEERLTT